MRLTCAGIGFACAQALGLEGSKVVLGDVSKDDLDQAKSSLTRNGIVCETVLCDVGDRAQVEAAVSKAVKAFGHVDIAVANAGIVRSADFLEMTDEDWDAVIRVNLKGVFLVRRGGVRWTWRLTWKNVCRIRTLCSSTEPFPLH